MARVRSDTRRLLLLLQLIHRHPGIRIARLAATLKQNERDVLRDLERLSLCGVPPFTPDDYLDAYVSKGRVYVRGAGGFRGASRLTPQEAVSLLAALRYLEESGGGPRAFPAVRAAARKIQEALTGDLGDATTALRRRVLWEAASGADATIFRTLQEALAARRVVRVTYYSESADEIHEGDVHPYDLAFARGQWYLIAFSAARGSVRTLRVDRIQAATLTDAPYEIPADFDASRHVSPSMLTAQSDEADVTMRVAPPLSEFAADEYPAAVSQPDGSVIVTMRGGNLTWAARQVLRWAPYAEILGPPEARAAAVRLAEDLGGAYDD